MEERISFFNELTDSLRLVSGCCVLRGDFNATLNQQDRSEDNGGTEIPFSNFMNDLNFVDLPLQHSKYTWYSSRNGGTWSRIDRWVVNEDVIMNFEDLNQVAESWGLSDHRAISLRMGETNFGPKPFMFYNDWLLDKEFANLVTNWWNTTLVQGWSGYVL